MTSGLATKKVDCLKKMDEFGKIKENGDWKEWMTESFEGNVHGLDCGVNS